LIVLVHGINTRGRWLDLIKPVLVQVGFVVAQTSYGKFGVPRFLMPFRFFRRKAIARVKEAIVAARLLYNPDKISVISHSFGTYVIAEIMAQSPEIKFHRIIFCGSVLREDFPLHHFLNRFDHPIINEVGTKDFWPALAESVTWGYGSVGSHGFHAPPVETRYHNGFYHSDFLTEEFCTKYWIPFLKKGDIVIGDKPLPLAVWVRLITSLPLRWIFVGLLILLFGLLGARLLLDRPAPPPGPNSQVQRFTILSSPHEPDAGRRDWTTTGLATWQERYPGGSTVAYSQGNRIVVAGCNGIMLTKQTESNYQVFVPDLGCDNTLRTRKRIISWIPYGSWISGGTMEDINFHQATYVPSLDSNAIDLKTRITSMQFTGERRLEVHFTVPTQPEQIVTNVAGISMWANRMIDGKSVEFRTMNGRAMKLKAGESAQFIVDLPEFYFDKKSGWDVKFCIGGVGPCLYSPNLTNGAP
jgi:hypothetical protein